MAIEKSPQAFCTSTAILILIFWKSQVYLDDSIATDKVSRIELAESNSGLQIWA